jgi:ABC-type uncharacterized transport system substrate-binding protein
MVMCRTRNDMRHGPMTVTVLVLPVLAAILGTVFQAEAQTAEKIYRVGVVRPKPYVTTLTTDPEHFLNSGFLLELRERGYVEGKNLVLEVRSVEGNPEELSEVVGELVRLDVDVIVAVAAPAVQAAQRATETIPIVMFGVGDPIATGLVASLARPGGSITGLSQVSPEIGQKRLALLMELVPRVSRVAILWNPTNPTNAPQIAAIKVAAQRLGVSTRRSSRSPRRGDRLSRRYALARRRPHDRGRPGHLQPPRADRRARGEGSAAGNVRMAGFPRGGRPDELQPSF